MADEPVHILIGLVFNRHGRVLVARRAPFQSQGGLWEFPGGKAEPGESPRQALQRELQEEVDIQFQRGSRLLEVVHDYGDSKVRLEAWRVDEYAGNPRGREGQQLKWASRTELESLAFPAANEEIIPAVRKLMGP